MPLIVNEPMRPAHRSDTQVAWTPSRADSFLSGSLYDPDAPRPRSSYAAEREAFRALLPMLMARYAGEFVAIKNGRVEDHDQSRRALARRFFLAHGNVPVCMAYVGPQRILRQITPFRVRPRA